MHPSTGHFCPLSDLPQRISEGSREAEGSVQRQGLQKKEGSIRTKEEQERAFPTKRINEEASRETERLPWWLSGKESTCQRRKHGSSPSPGRSHMLQSNYAWASATGPCRTAACDRQQRKRLQQEARTPQPESSPAGRSYRKAHTAKKTQHSKKMNRILKRERENGKPETGVERGEVVYVPRE